uniref:Uncharacterized protein n=1 Tax=Arundo donax TaxID=35708 RepID=A0A0A8ZZH6_ARUDO
MSKKKHFYFTEIVSTQPIGQTEVSTQLFFTGSHHILGYPKYIHKLNRIKT